MRQLIILVLSTVLLCSITACAGPTPTPSPIPSTATPTRPPTALPLPTLPSSGVTPQATATLSANLKKDSFEFVAPLSADDAELVTQAVENLTGVQDVQTNGQELDVVYDLKQVSPAQIITAIKGLGFAIKQ